MPETRTPHGRPERRGRPFAPHNLRCVGRGHTISEPRTARAPARGSWCCAAWPRRRNCPAADRAARVSVMWSVSPPSIVRFCTDCVNMRPVPQRYSSRPMLSSTTKSCVCPSGKVSSTSFFVGFVTSSAKRIDLCSTLTVKLGAIAHLLLLLRRLLDLHHGRRGRRREADGHERCLGVRSRTTRESDCAEAEQRNQKITDVHHRTDGGSVRGGRAGIRSRTDRLPSYQHLDEQATRIVTEKL